MRDLLVQFAELGASAPRDWSAFDLWAGDRLPARAVNALTFHGWIFEGFDTLVGEIDGDDLIVYAVCDDPADWAGQEWARVVRFRPLGADPAFGGAINVRASVEVYGAGASLEALGRFGHTVRPFDELALPAKRSRAFELSGVWLSEEAFAAHRLARGAVNWRSWSHGVDSSLLDSTGRVRPQRPLGRYKRPDGTRTYFLREVPLATSVHTAPNENEMIRDLPGSSTQQSDSVGAACKFSWSWSTDASEPAVAAWPGGDYRAQLDIPATGVDLIFGFSMIDGCAGHFARVDSTLDNDLEVHEQIEPAFMGAGLHLATTGPISWTPGSTGDRIEALLAAVRVTGHGNQTIFVRFSPDCFFDGPWTGGSAPPPQGLLLADVAIESLISGNVEIDSVIASNVEIA